MYDVCATGQDRIRNKYMRENKLQRCLDTSQEKNCSGRRYGQNEGRGKQGQGRIKGEVSGKVIKGEHTVQMRKRLGLGKTRITSSPLACDKGMDKNNE